jgi:hypothetical protein
MTMDDYRLFLDEWPESVGIPTSEGWLPLHCAVRGNHQRLRGSDLVADLHAKYPGAVRVRDRQGRLPLHLLLAQRRYSRAAYIKALLDAWPESIRAVDLATGLFPVHIAAASGASVVAVYLLSRMCPEALLGISRDGGARNQQQQLQQQQEQQQQQQQEEEEEQQQEEEQQERSRRPSKVPRLS